MSFIRFKSKRIVSIFQTLLVEVKPNMPISSAGKNISLIVPAQSHAIPASWRVIEEFCNLIVMCLYGTTDKQYQQSKWRYKWDISADNGATEI